MSIAIRVQNLHYAYKKTKGKQEQKEALKGLNFEVREGKITGLLGPNGSGKSTAFKILSTQICADSGEAFVGAYSVQREETKVRSLIGISFQSPSLDPQLTVEENLQIHAKLYGLSSELIRVKIPEYLDLFKVSDRAKERVKTLSGGLARRVELAKTLLSEPRILLLDEPTTGLDPKARAEFWNEIRSIVLKKGITVLVSTHILEEADLCDHLIFISEGRVHGEASVAGQSSPQDLKKQFGAEILHIKSKNVPSLEFALKSKLLPDDKVVHQESGVLRIQTKHSRELLKTLSSELLNDSSLAITHINWGEATLADVYFRQTGQNL